MGVESITGYGPLKSKTSDTKVSGVIYNSNDMGITVNLSSSSDLPSGDTINLEQTQPDATSSKATTEIYTVKAGDSLWKIAKVLGVSVDALKKANPQIQNFNKIKPGMKINIPGKTSNPFATKPPEQKQASTAAVAQKPNAAVEAPKEVKETAAPTSPQKVATPSKLEIVSTPDNASPEEKEFFKTISERFNPIKDKNNEHLTANGSIYNLGIIKDEYDGNLYLTLSRPKNSKYDEKLRNYISLGAIKKALRLNKGVIKRANPDINDITQNNNYNLDERTIDPGKTLRIPLDEIGKKYYHEDKDLIAAVEKLPNEKTWLQSLRSLFESK